MKHISMGLTVLIIAIGLTGCETTEGHPDRTAGGALTGGAIGAGSGAIIGSTSGHAGEGALIGGAIGAVTGGLIGHSIDQAQRESLERQSPQTLQRVEQGQPMGLADIKALARADVSEEVIISQIRNSGTVYHLSTAEIIDLKDAGVSEKVIDFMINTPSVNISSVPPPPTEYQEPVVVAQLPPPPIVEYVPAPRPGYVWIGGSWVWYRGQWVWVRGRWAYPPHQHAYWVPPQYERRGGTTVWFSGHWQ